MSLKSLFNFVTWMVGLLLGVSLVFGQFGSDARYWLLQSQAKLVRVRIIDAKTSYYLVANGEFSASTQAVKLVFVRDDEGVTPLTGFSHFCDLCQASEVRRRLNVRSFDELIGVTRVAYLVDGRIFLRRLSGREITESMLFVFFAHVWAAYLAWRFRGYLMTRYCH